MEKARREAMEKRVAMLTTKLLERIRPFVEAKDPGNENDPETKAFYAKMEKEADDLKLESFGVEVRWTSHHFTGLRCLNYMSDLAYHRNDLRDESDFIHEISKTSWNVRHMSFSTLLLIEAISPQSRVLFTPKREGYHG